MTRNHYLSERAATAAVFTLAIVAAFVFAFGFEIYTATHSKADGSKWSGCYIGAGVSYDSATGSGLGAGGYGAAPFLGCDLQRDRLVFGLWGDYSFDQFKWAGLTINDRGWAAGARAGFLVTKDVLAYGLVGWSQQTAKAFGGSVDLSGVEYGGGLEVDLGKGWFTQLEAKYEPLDVKNSTFQAKNEEVRLGLLYKFNLFGVNEQAPFTADRPLK